MLAFAPGPRSATRTPQAVPPVRAFPLTVTPLLPPSRAMAAPWEFVNWFPVIEAVAVLTRAIGLSAANWLLEMVTFDTVPPMLTAAPAWPANALASIRTFDT